MPLQTFSWRITDTFGSNEPVEYSAPETMRRVLKDASSWVISNHGIYARSAVGRVRYFRSAESAMREVERMECPVAVRGVGEND